MADLCDHLDAHHITPGMELFSCTVCDQKFHMESFLRVHVQKTNHTESHPIIKSTNQGYFDHHK